jgi:Tfp pilus assembly protein PilZ
MTVEFSQGEMQGTGIIGDVSRRGMFVQTTRIPGTGPVLRLTVNLPGGRKLVLRGKVVRNADGTTSTPPNGFGLRLVDEWPDYENLFRRRDKPK